MSDETYTLHDLKCPNPECKKEFQLKRPAGERGQPELRDLFERAHSITFGGAALWKITHFRLSPFFLQETWIPADRDGPGSARHRLFTSLMCGASPDSRRLRAGGCAPQGTK